MTAAGHAALEDELKGRIRIERPRLIQRIQQAIADDANLVENSEYQAAQVEQNVNEARIDASGRLFADPHEIAERAGLGSPIAHRT